MTEYENKKILVTGGAGFVGSQLSKRLSSLGAHVTVLDDLTTGQTHLLDDSVEFIEKSVEDAELVKELVNQSDYVFHLACRGLAASTGDIRSDADVNIGGMINILDALKEMDPATRPRVLYSSTCSVYGNAVSLPISEESKFNILSPYAASKLAAEYYCGVYYEMFDIDYTIVRYSNVFGPGQSSGNPYCGVVTKFFEACLAGEQRKIHGNGLQTRDFTYIDDAVEGTLLAMLSKRSTGQIYNLGTGFETNIHELERLISKACGLESDAVLVDKRDIDNVNRRVLSSEKARQNLRWIPETLLENAMSKTYEWILTQQK